MRAGLISLWLWAVACAGALADEGVVLRHRPGLRDGLCAALRIQLSGLAEVRCESEEGAALLPDRIAGAARRVEETGTRLAVLLERDPDPGLVRMYIVASQGDRAVIAFEAVEDRAEPDIDRSLALKVRDAYEVVAVVERAAEASLPDVEASAASADAQSTGRSSVAAALGPSRDAKPTTSWLLFLEAGGGFALSEHFVGLGSVALGVGRQVARLRWELGLGARFLTALRAERDFGEVSVRERAVDLSARALWLVGRHMQLGGVFETQLSFASAEGHARDGDAGDETRLRPVLALGADLRVRLFEAAHARLAPMLELSPIAQSFRIDDRPVIESGHARFSCTLSLIVALPLARNVQPKSGGSPP